MPFSIPSLLERSRSVWTAIRARLPGADGEIWPNNFRIIGKVLAMAAHEGDLRSEFLFRQIFTSTAEGDYLDLHAFEVGLVRKAASPAAGTLIFAATPGVSFAAGIRFVRQDGAFFVSTDGATASGNSVEIPVAAEEPGLAGNTPAGASFSTAAPVPDLDPSGVAGPNGLGNGADGERDEPLRARILFRKRKRPRGGAVADYVEWATEVPGIAAAYAKGWSPGAGSVSVWPLLAGSGTGAIPTTADLEAVAAYIEARRPGAATVYVQQAAPRRIDVQIGALVPDTLAVRAEIEAEVRDMFDARAVVALPDEATTFSQSWIEEAVSSALGEESHVLIAPPADITLAPGEWPVLGSILPYI